MLGPCGCGLTVRYLFWHLDWIIVDSDEMFDESVIDLNDCRSLRVWYDCFWSGLSAKGEVRKRSYIHIHTYIHVTWKWRSTQSAKCRTYTYIHTYIHTHTNIHIQTYIHTYTPTYIHTYIHTDRQTYKHFLLLTEPWAQWKYQKLSKILF